MPTLHVLTVTPDLPVWLLDRVMSGVERDLHDAGASRVWISGELAPLAVMAEFPDPPLAVEV